MGQYVTFEVKVGPTEPAFNPLFASRPTEKQRGDQPLVGARQHGLGKGLTQHHAERESQGNSLPLTRR